MARTDLNLVTINVKSSSDVKGTHTVYCIMCGEPYMTVTHGGSDKIIKKCPDCEQGKALNVCFKCWSGRKWA